jgi:hypothetical protein
MPVCPVCNGQRIISELNGLPPGIPTQIPNVEEVGLQPWFEITHRIMPNMQVVPTQKPTPDVSNIQSRKP